MASSSSRKRTYSDFQRETPAVSKKVFDAFINHRGLDVKDTLAFALHESLEEKGYWTFLDDMEMKLGDSIESSIQDAIYSSKVQIAIFSPRYAESSWCLDELLLMLETKARFIPIFCDVQSFEVRYPEKGVYAAAFAKHEEKGRFSKEKLDQWKAALHSSSLIRGYEFSTANDNVESLCVKIASAVQEEVRKPNVFGRHGEVVPDAEAASTSTSVEVKKSSLLPRDSNPVGLQSKVEDIRRFLQDPLVPVIAVVGMGGTGKTFLLQNVYKSEKNEYEHSIWLSVSKSYFLKDLQRDIASHIGLSTETVSEVRAAEMIRKRLEGKRCLLVLDDLWELFPENSLIDKLGLPDDKDCKIVITTRNREVALNCKAEIYEVKILSDEDSWKLFCIYAFPNSVGNRGPRVLEEEGLKIVKQCGNLPLAIKTIAASLANNTGLRKWELKRRQLEGVVTPIGDPAHLSVMKILKLSYDSLPAYLKPCFAYVSFFPEDAEIDAEYLINLWIAEGFIPPGEEDQWNLGWDWLNQLDQRCLLQLCETQRPHLSFMRYKYCKIHDLLYDLAIQISEENKCVFSVEVVSSHTSGVTGWHRILLAKKDLRVFNAISGNRPIYLRTLALFQNNEMTCIPANLFTAMRGLRVLDLSHTGISTLPESLGKMILLKVLKLTGTRIQFVPECVRHLKSLFFLALPTSVRKLPEMIGELNSLQYLKCDLVSRMPKGILKLRSLRTLRSWQFTPSTEEDRFMKLHDLVNMTQLQEVWLKLVHEMDLKRTEEGILAQLVNMRHLHIINNVRLITNNVRLGQFSEKMRAMKHLEHLSLYGFGIPGWICELENLRELNLRETRVQRVPEEFGKSGAFPLLRFLNISEFWSLEEFPEVEEGAMPSLQILRLCWCPNLKKVEGLELLKTAEVFDFTDSDALIETFREGGEYWNKIKATNPHVVITFHNYY